MLMKRKVKQKKVVVKQIEWLERPLDVLVQEKKDDKAVFTARLSEKEKKGKWYFRSAVIAEETFISKKMHVKQLKMLNFVAGDPQGHQGGGARAGEID